MNILIIEDDKILSESIKMSFKKYCFANIVSVMNSYIDYLNNSSIGFYDIILLDICLGDNNFDGLRLLEDIRKKSSKVPVIMMSSFNDYSILEKAFALGAHDYIIKPFRNRELQIRIQRWFNNYIFLEYYSIQKIISYSYLKYNLGTCEFYYHNKKIILTKGSKYILLLLLINKESLVKNEYLSEKIWGNSDIGNNLRIKILRLKKGLRKYNLDGWIVTIRGEGYLLKESNKLLIQ